MGADLWQLANGWGLVDWSLNVGSAESTVSGGGLPRRKNAPYTPYRPYVVVFPNTAADDEDALALILALL